MEEIRKMLCSYGCEREATHQFGNGKWCCSENQSGCPEIKKKVGRKGRTPWNKGKKGQTCKSSFRKGNIPWKKSKKVGPHTEEWKKNHSEIMKGERNPNKRLEVRKKKSEKLKGRKPLQQCIEAAKKANKERLLNGGALYLNSFPRDPEKVKSCAEKSRNWMLNGGAAYITSFIKNSSKPENDLFVLTCKILPRPIHNYPVYKVGKGK